MTRSLNTWKRLLAGGFAAGVSLAVCAQNTVDWIKTHPSSQPAPGVGGTYTVPEVESQPAKPVDPKYRAKIHTELAAAYFQAGNLAVALEETKVALEADPNHVQAYSVRGLIHTQLREYGKAAEDFRKALGIDPKNPDVNNNYGWYLCETGQPRQSIQYFLNAVKDPLYETPDVAYTNAGTCALKAGDVDGAQNYLLEALRIAKTPAPFTRFRLAEVLYQRGNLDEAKVYLGEAIKMMEPPTPEALWLAIRLERKLGNKAAEGTYASQLRGRYPTSKEYQSFLKGNFE